METDLRGMSDRWRYWLRIGALLLPAAALYAWNLYSVPLLTGYDAPGHAGYVLTIVKDGKLPGPYDGWSTFHPPLYYLAGSAVWRMLEPLGPLAVGAGLRALGALAILAGGLAVFHVLRRLGASLAVALASCALTLFVPAVQMAAAMIGNEAFAAGLAAIALIPLLGLQRDPRDLRKASLTGLLVGLALISKFTGVIVAAGAIVPFLGPSWDRRKLAALGLLVMTLGLVAGPVYYRNYALTGTFFPMTRVREPMRSVESAFVLKERQVKDYLSFDASCLHWPSIYRSPSMQLVRSPFNAEMTKVWCLAYASTWYDAFFHRISLRERLARFHSGVVVTTLGLVPTAILAWGFLLALAAAMRSRGRSPDAPLVAMAIAGMVVLVVFTWRAPSMSAVKGSYLLPLAFPAAVFFARGANALGHRLRKVALAISLCAALVSAIAFTNGLLYETEPMRPAVRQAWEGYARILNSPHITDAMDYLLGGRR